MNLFALCLTYGILIEREYLGKCMLKNVGLILLYVFPQELFVEKSTIYLLDNKLFWFMMTGPFWHGFYSWNEKQVHAIASKPIQKNKSLLNMNYKV